MTCPKVELRSDYNIMTGGDNFQVSEKGDLKMFLRQLIYNKSSVKTFSVVTFILSLW